MLTSKRYINMIRMGLHNAYSVFLRKFSCKVRKGTSPTRPASQTLYRERCVGEVKPDHLLLKYLIHEKCEVWGGERGRTTVLPMARSASYTVLPQRGHLGPVLLLAPAPTTCSLGLVLQDTASHNDTGRISRRLQTEKTMKGLSLRVS